MANKKELNPEELNQINGGISMECDPDNNRYTVYDDNNKKVAVFFDQKTANDYINFQLGNALDVANDQGVY